jgi:hypothetical protein
MSALTPAWLPVSWAGNFPGMSREDRTLWRRYLRDHAHEWDAFAYNVTVGGLDCELPDVHAEVAAHWRYCTAKRIDALALKDGRPTIVEVRYQAGVSAAGSLLVYRELYHELVPPPPRAGLLLITDDIAPDTERACRALGIPTVRVPE